MAKGFQKGHKKFGGRTQGMAQRVKLAYAVAERLEELGHDPIFHMVQQAENPETPPEVKAKLECELGNYVYPKRKAIEHSGIPKTAEVDDHRADAIEVLRARIARILERERTAGVLPIANAG